MLDLPVGLKRQKPQHDTVVFVIAFTLSCNINYIATD